MLFRHVTAALAFGLVVLASAPTGATRLADAGYPCVMLPNAQIDLTPPSDGIVAEILVERGASVSAGQLVVQLENAVERAELALAEARTDRNRGIDLARVRVGELERQVERLMPLAAKGITSAQILDGAVVELATARLQMEQAIGDQHLAGLEAARSRVRLEQRQLRSPVDGIVVERFLDVGELASRSGQAVVIKIASIDPLIADVRVPLELFDEIEAGDTATVRFNLDGQPERSARVLNVDRVADAASGTIRVRIELDNADGALPAGASARVLF